MPPLPPEDLDHIFARTRGLWDDLRSQSVFITGGTGFVGTWLLESLLWVQDRLSLNVTATVLTRNPERFEANAQHLARHPAVRLLRGNVCDFDFPSGRYPFIIHAATEAYFEPDSTRPLGTFSSDTEGTRRVLEFAVAHGVRRMLFTSSGAVYGRQPADLTHIPEEYGGAPSTTDPASAYGLAKRVSEFMCGTYGRVHGFDPVIARLFAFVGPALPLDAHYAVGNFINDVLHKRPVHVSGDGTPWRSYLYAADLAIWLWTLLIHGKPAYPYNVGSSRDLTIRDLAQTVVRVASSDTVVEIARSPVPGAPQLRYVPSTDRAERELGLRSEIALDEGIRRTCAWHGLNVPRRCNAVA